MEMLKAHIARMNEELDDAQHYAEKYIEMKAFGETANASKFREMSTDEMKHATYLKEMTATMIGKIESFYKMTAEEQQEWQNAIMHFADRIAMIKQILSM